MKFVRTVMSENFFRRFRDIFAPHLSAVGADTRVLERADIEIPGEQYVALWEAVGTVNPTIGLDLGMQTQASDFGALGHALHCAPSVEKALLGLHRFITVFAQETVINFECDAKTAYIEYQIVAPTILYRRQDSEFTIASIYHQLNLLTGITIKPLRIDFEHNKPANTSGHKQVFQCPIYFNQPTNRIYLSLETLHLPVAHANERLYEALEPYLERQRQERAVSDDILPQVTSMIASSMSSGTLSLIEISDQMGLSRRTLQRRLKDLGIEFSSLIEDVRRELALAYMQGSDYSVTEISLLVGYSESSSFTRAFRRWTGQSPQQYRGAHHTRH